MLKEDEPIVVDLRKEKERLIKLLQAVDYLIASRNGDYKQLTLEAGKVVKKDIFPLKRSGSSGKGTMEVVVKYLQKVKKCNTDDLSNHFRGAFSDLDPHTRSSRLWSALNTLMKKGHLRRAGDTMTLTKSGESYVPRKMVS